MARLKESVPIPKQNCWYCGYTMDMAGALDSNRDDKPTPGSWNICISCSAPGRFDENLKIVKLDKGELIEFFEDKDATLLRSAIVAILLQHDTDHKKMWSLSKELLHSWPQ